MYVLKYLSTYHTCVKSQEWAQQWGTSNAGCTFYFQKTSSVLYVRGAVVGQYLMLLLGLISCACRDSLRHTVWVMDSSHLVCLSGLVDLLASTTMMMICVSKLSYRICAFCFLGPMLFIGWMIIMAQRLVGVLFRILTTHYMFINH